jgi:hypothetical protein
MDAEFPEANIPSEHYSPPIEITDKVEPNKFSAFKQWVQKRKLSLAVGASIVSLGVGVAVNPTEEVIHKVEEQAAWVVPTEVGLDASIGVGAAMMLAATGTAIKNPFKAKGYLKDLPERANNSLLFKSGFALSTAAALGWGSIAAGSIVAYLPPESWGALTFPVADLAATVALRRTIWQGIQQPEESLNT